MGEGVRCAGRRKAQGEAMKRKLQPRVVKHPVTGEDIKLIDARDAWKEIVRKDPERAKRAEKALLTGEHIVPTLQARIADVVLDEKYRHKASQRAKAQKPRGAGDDGRTMRKLIADVAKLHPVDASPNELLPHVHAAAQQADMRLIGLKRLRDVLRDIRKPK